MNPLRYGQYTATYIPSITKKMESGGQSTERPTWILTWSRETTHAPVWPGYTQECQGGGEGRAVPLDAGNAVLVLVLPALNYAFYNMQIRKLEQDIERHLSWVEWCMLIIPTLSWDRRIASVKRAKE